MIYQRKALEDIKDQIKEAKAHVEENEEEEEEDNEEGIHADIYENIDGG